MERRGRSFRSSRGWIRKRPLSTAYLDRWEMGERGYWLCLRHKRRRHNEPRDDKPDIGWTHHHDRDDLLPNLRDFSRGAHLWPDHRWRWRASLTGQQSLRGCDDLRYARDNGSGLARCGVAHSG